MKKTGTNEKRDRRERLTVSDSTQPTVEDTGLRCPQCGYNLTGLTEDRCPECGLKFERSALSSGKPTLAHFVCVVALFAWFGLSTVAALLMFLDNLPYMMKSSCLTGLVPGYWMIHLGTIGVAYVLTLPIPRRDTDWRLARIILLLMIGEGVFLLVFDPNFVRMFIHPLM